MGTIGTVLTPQMKEQTIYVADDGERFDSPEDCQLWERLATKHAQFGMYQMVGSGDYSDQYPPESAQEFLDLLEYEQAKDLFDKPGQPFVDVAKRLRAASNWIWGE